jgi:hypothetical protein
MRFMPAFHRLLPITALAALSACAALDDEGTGEDQVADQEEDAIQDDELNLIAIAERTNGNQLRFYEPLPGNILTVELGTGLTMPVSHDAVALFRAAAPGVEVPRALAEASARAQALAPADDGEPSVAALSVPDDQAVDRAPELAGPPPVAAAANPCEINTFIANECTDGDQEWCKIGWWNGFYAYNTTVNVMHNAVCPLNGQVSLTLLVNSVPKANYPVSQGEIGKVAWVNLSSNFGFYTQVTNASGNQFHVGGAASNF